MACVACDEMASRTKGYADIAAAVRQRAHPAVIRQNARELFARMVFNIFVGNDDDHLRNHGFVRDPRLSGWRLSPLYDVVPRPGVAYERFLHLEVGLQGKLATLDNAMSAYARFDLERPDVVRLSAQMAHQVQHWREFLKHTALRVRSLISWCQRFVRLRRLQVPIYVKSFSKRCVMPSVRSLVEQCAIEPCQCTSSMLPSKAQSRRSRQRSLAAAQQNPPPSAAPSAKPMQVLRC